MNTLGRRSLAPVSDSVVRNESLPVPAWCGRPVERGDRSRVPRWHPSCLVVQRGPL